MSTPWRKERQAPETSVFSSCRAYPLNAHRAFLEVGLQRDRIGGVQRHLVNELRFVEPRHEHELARGLVAAAGFDPGTDVAAAGLHLDLVAAPQLQLRCVVRVHEAYSF